MGAKSLYILVLSFIPIAAAIAIVARQGGRLGLLHIYLVMVGLSYGAYTSIDVLINPVDEIDEWAVTVLVVSITLCMGIMALALRLISPQARSRVSIQFLVQEVQRAPAWMLLLLSVVVVSWSIYAYFTWGFIAHFDQHNVEYPRWVGPVRQLFVAIGFGLFIWLTARIAMREGMKLLSWDLALWLVMAALLTVNGRRVFLSLIVVSLIVFLSARGKLAKLLTVGNSIRVVLAFAAFLLFSNVYQTVRGSVAASEVPGIGLADAIFDFGVTKENLEARQAIWRFHYIVASAQVRDVTDVVGGEILKSGVIGAIPNVLYPDKPPVYGDDFLVCAHYREGCPSFWLPDFDLPQTLFSTVQADFGFFFLILVPAIILLVLLVISLFGRLSREGRISPVLYILVFGMAVELLVNVEQSIGNYLIWARDVGILVLTIGLPQLLTRGARQSVSVGA